MNVPLFLVGVRARSAQLALVASCLALGACLRSGYDDTPGQGPEANGSDAGASLVGDAGDSSYRVARSLSPRDEGAGTDDSMLVLRAAELISGKTGADADVPTADAGEPADAAQMDPLLGIWSGTVTDRRSGFQYNCCMTITQVTEAGAAAGGTNYVGYCADPGTLNYVQSAAGLYTFNEFFRAGSVCATFRDRQTGIDGVIKATLMTSSMMQWDWYAPSTGAHITSGHLTLVSACP